MAVIKVWIQIFVAVMVFQSIARAQTTWFHCQREDQTCSALGTCASSTGVCTCTAGTTEGYNCKGVATQKKAATDCGGTCSPDAYGCYEFTTGTETCYCKEDQMGSDCTDKRATVTCDASKMSISMTPLSSASKLFVPGFETTAGCSVVPTAGTFSIDLSHTTGCGAGVVGTTVINDSPNAGDKTYKNWLVLRYVNSLDSPLNYLFEASCVIGESGTYSVTGEIAQVTVDYMTNLLNTPLTADFGDAFTLKILDSTDVEITTPVAVGTDIKLVLSLTSTDVASDLMYSSCDIRETATGTATLSIPIIQSGCAVTSGDGTHAVRGGITKKLDNTVVLPMSAVKFLNFDKVYFVCEVKLCFTGCTHPACVTVEAKKRRKREVSQVSQGIDQQRTLVAAIRVVDRFSRDPSENTTPISSSTADIEDCGLSMPVVSALIVSGVGVLLLSFVSVFLVVKFLKLKKTSSEKEEKKNGHKF